ncbi:MAG: cellulase family glycosylhydrolase, partial [Pseudoxanthomonas sp.]
PAVAADFLRVDGTRIVDGQGKPVILRGMGLGGWMLQEGYMLELPQFGTQQRIRAHIEELIGAEATAAFYRAWLDNHTSKADIDALARWGFNSVRLPMHYALYTLPVAREPAPGRQTWLEEGFRRTDQLIAWARANDMVVILDMHAAPGGQGNDVDIADRDPDRPSLWQDPANQDKLVALWRELAQRYRDEPAVAAYDLLNEPNWGFGHADDPHGCKETGNAPLRALYARITAAIREVDRRHIVIVEGNCWGNNYAGVFDGGVWDANLAASFHKYWNHTDRKSLEQALAVRDAYRVPLWLGESGENSNDWYARTVELVEGEGIGWSWWPLKKLGFNNPLQIVPNPGYRRLLDYWNGKGPRPAPEQAEAALMQLARHDVRYEHNLQHADVVDALIRSPHSLQPVPFKPHRIGADGGQVAAADFDMGRAGVAYHGRVAADEHAVGGGDWVQWNAAQAYRNDGVDLARRADGGFNVAGLQPGQWLRYTLEAVQAGRYRLRLQGAGAGRAWIEVNGRRVAAALAPGAGADIELLDGRNTVVVGAASGRLDLQALRFAPLR